MHDRTVKAIGTVLAPGGAAGEALVLDEPLSFWGGVDPATGRIVDGRHPQAGNSIRGRVVVMPAGRGSSSSSTVLAETVRAGTGPVAVVLREPDAILAVGALVAAELYGLACPVVVLDPPSYGMIRTGDLVEVIDREGGALVRVDDGGTSGQSA
jgi:predicted aconitase with swiveling domain